MAIPFDWDKLRIFHVAAKAGSFTHAAHILHLSQSAISRQVSALEHEVGVQLFQRHARGLILTEQGEILYQTTQSVFMQLEHARFALAESQKKPAGYLSVTTTFGLGSYWLVNKIAHFLKAYPEMQLDIKLDDDEIDLNMRQADCALRLYQPLQPDLIQKKLFTVHMHLYASEDYISRYGAVRDASELPRHRRITFGDLAPPVLSHLNWLATYSNKEEPPRKPALQINNILSIKEAVKLGIGIALLPDYLIAPEDRLVRLLPEKADLPSFDAFFCYPAALKSSAKLHAFRDFIFSEAKNWRF